MTASATATAFDWQSWLAIGLGLLAVLHLTRRWWPQRRRPHANAASPHPDQPGTDARTDTPGCEVKAPGACGSGCGGCGPTQTPVKVHRRASRDNPGASSGR